MRDLTGKIIKSSAQRVGSDEWEVIEFPAIMPSGNPCGLSSGAKRSLRLCGVNCPPPSGTRSTSKTQRPKRAHSSRENGGKSGRKDYPPQCEFVIQSWDTAFLKTQRADYSACTTWGVFYHPDDDGISQPNIILLDAYKERLEFPELKKTAYEMWSEMQPDAFIVEGKAAGMPLIFELRAMGIPVSEYTPSRGNDKILVRLWQGLTPLLTFVRKLWDCMGTRDTIRWHEEVIEEFAAFPISCGGADDLVDSSTQALLRNCSGRAAFSLSLWRLGLTRKMTLILTDEGRQLLLRAYGFSAKQHSAL